LNEKEILDSILDDIKKDSNAAEVEILEINECKDLINYDNLINSVLPGKFFVLVEWLYIYCFI